MIPVLEWRLEGGVLSYRWQNVVHGFHMPLDVAIGAGPAFRLHPTERWQALQVGTSGSLEVDRGFYVEVREVE